MFFPDSTMFSYFRGFESIMTSIVFLFSFSCFFVSLFLNMISTIPAQSLAMSNTIKARTDEDDDSPVPIFPPGVIIEILTRLPIKILIQLQLVCKDWQSMIYDPSYFKQLHMKRAKIMFSWHNSHVLPAKQIEPGLAFCYVHGCDGLLLVKGKTENNLFIWNPATRRVLVLPDPQEGTLRFAFAFVPATKSYRIVSFFKDRGEIGCQVLSLGQESNNIWRRLNNFPKITLSPEKNKTGSVVVSGGAVHCVLVNEVGEETNTEIVSLELGTGNFTVNHVPKQVGRWLDWDGKLAIANVVGQNLEVVELGDYKKQEKKMTHLPFLKGNANGEVVPLFASSGKIWFWWRGGKVFTYKTATEKCTDVTLAPNLYLLTTICPYKPSLIGFQGMVPDTKFEMLRAHLNFS